MLSAPGGIRTPDPRIRSLLDPSSTTSDVREKEQVRGAFVLSSTVTDWPRLSSVMWSKCGLPTPTTPAAGFVTTSL
jgi:hypothetical protein